MIPWRISLSFSNQVFLDRGCLRAKSFPGSEEQYTCMLLEQRGLALAESRISRNFHHHPSISLDGRISRYFDIFCKPVSIDSNKV